MLVVELDRPEDTTILTKCHPKENDATRKLAVIRNIRGTSVLETLSRCFSPYIWLLSVMC